MILNKIILFILLTFLFSECPDMHEDYNDQCYFNDDINFLNALLQNSCIDYDDDGEYGVVECVLNNSMDTNQDGIFHPTEIGIQVWENNRLVVLDCNWNDNISNCQLAGPIPFNIDNATE